MMPSGPVSICPRYAWLRRRVGVQDVDTFGTVFSALKNFVLDGENAFKKFPVSHCWIQDAAARRDSQETGWAFHNYPGVLASPTYSTPNSRPKDFTWAHSRPQQNLHSSRGGSPGQALCPLDCDAICASSTIHLHHAAFDANRQ